MNILGKLYVGDNPDLSFTKAGTIVLTSKGRKNTALYRDQLRGYRTFEINSEPDMASLDILCRVIFESGDVERIIAYGGGSVIDSAKLMSVALACGKTPREFFGNIDACKEAVPLIAIPTTYGSGSEATEISVVVLDGLKKSVRSNLLLPDEVYLVEANYPNLGSLISSKYISDTLCHAIESFYSPKGDAISKQFSLASLNILLGAESRIDIALASLFAGVAENRAGVSIIHALAYPLQNILGISHSVANAIVLNRVVAQRPGWFDLGRLCTVSQPEVLVDYIKSITSFTKVIKPSIDDGEEYYKNYLLYSKLITNYPGKLSSREIIKFYEEL